MLRFKGITEKHPHHHRTIESDGHVDRSETSVFMFQSHPQHDVFPLLVSDRFITAFLLWLRSGDTEAWRKSPKTRSVSLPLFFRKMVEWFPCVELVLFVSQSWSSAGSLAQKRSLRMLAVHVRQLQKGDMCRTVIPQISLPPRGAAMVFMAALSGRVAGMFNEFHTKMLHPRANNTCQRVKSFPL